MSKLSLLRADVIPPFSKSSQALSEQVASVSLAANSGSTKIYGVPLTNPGDVKFVRATVKCSIGRQGNAQVFVVDATANTFTLVGHGITVSGTPIVVGGTAVPAGFTAGTVYYAGVTSTSVLQVYDTPAHAVTNDGATGLINPTSAGTAVTVTTVQQLAVYVAQASGRNQNGTAVILGANNALSTFEDIAAWDCAWAVNTSTNTLDLKVTPDVQNITQVDAFIEIYSI